MFETRLLIVTFCSIMGSSLAQTTNTFSCVSYGVNGEIPKAQLCVCPQNYVSCAKTDQLMCIKQESVCNRNDLTLPTNDICPTNNLLVNCTGKLQCALKESVCCKKDSILCDGKCDKVCGAEKCEEYRLAITCLNAEITDTKPTITSINFTECKETGYKPKSSCGEYTCGANLKGVLYGTHPSSACLLADDACKASADAEDCQSPCPDTTKTCIGCSPTDTPNYKCVDLPIVCPEKTIDCGNEYGNQCLEMSLIEQECIKLNQTTTMPPSTRTTNPNANQYRAGVIVSCLFIAIAAVIASVAAIAGSIPMLMKSTSTTRPKRRRRW